MTRTPHQHRAAFTLIELLVVISIIAILSALAAGAFSRIRTAQTRSATDAALNKINSLIERRWKAVNDQVTDDIKNNHPGFQAVLQAVGNRDLAKSIWTHAKMKNEFPMSFAEAKTAVNINVGAVASPMTVYQLPAKAMFNSLPAASAGTPEESAVCLYLAVTANAGGGTATDQDGLQQMTGDSLLGSGLRCFKDPLGTPIAFIRLASNSELDGAPFVATGTGAIDPFDRRPQTSGSQAQPLLPPFAAANPAWWVSMQKNVPTWAGLTASGPYPAGHNFVPTAISAGLDKQWFGPVAGDPYGLPPVPDTDASKDNQLSYRLRREGNRGD